VSERPDKFRTYLFGEHRRAGLFGTLPWSFLLPIGAALLAAWTTVTGWLPAPVGVIVAAAGVVAGFGRFRGQPLHALLPRLVGLGWRRLRGRHSWVRPVPLVTESQMPAAVPRPLSGLDLYEVDVAWLTMGHKTAIGVVHDRRAGTVTAQLRVTGDGQFALVDPRSQDMRLEGWGAAIGGFARERSHVARVTWRDWAAPMPVADQIGELQARWADEATSTARDSYLALMGEVAPQVVRHDVLIEVTVEMAAGRGLRRRGPQPLPAAITVLSDELRLFRERLDSAGLTVQGVLSAAELVTAMRVRSDPAAMEQLASLRQSLATAAGVAAPNFGPMAMREELACVHVDRALHRSWWFARWPRREVPANWLDRVIFEADVTRSVSVVFEPIPPSRSDHAVDRELVTREANIESRQRRGFRVKGKDHKALERAEAREQELNAGYAEMLFVGLVTLTAPDVDTLEAQAAEVEQDFAHAGIELQVLYGQQPDGWVASLPLGRTLARRLVPT
jgi:hypothetical protein